MLAYLLPVADAISLGSQRAELAEVKAQLTLAQQRVARLQALQGTVPQKEIDAAQAELQSLRGREKALAGSLTGKHALVAPASGVIAKASALNGQVVDTREVLFEVVSPNRMLIQASTTDASLAGRVQGGTLANAAGVELTLQGLGKSLVNGAIPLTFRASSKTRKTIYRWQLANLSPCWCN